MDADAGAHSPVGGPVAQARPVPGGVMPPQPDAPRRKVGLDELAILGGEPAFAAPVPVGQPNIGDREALTRRIDDMLERRSLADDGPYVRELEARVAALAGVRHCVTTCNATVALELAIRALGMEGEVVVPSFTSVATAHALRWQGVDPLFCDIDPRTHTIDPSRIEELAGTRTSGIIGVHVWGRPCDAAALREVADRRGLALLFDASHAFGCTHRGRPVGSFGDAEVFSFRAGEFVSAFDGGAVVTDDGRVADAVRRMRDLGRAEGDEVVGLGTEGRMSEASAAMGLTSLEEMARFGSINRDHRRSYVEGFAGLPGIALLEPERDARSNHQHIVIEVREEAGLERDTLREVLHAENVLAGRQFHPGCHRVEPYRTEMPEARAWLPVTERVASRVLTLPTGAALRRPDVEAVCSIVRLAVEHAGELRLRLGRGAPPPGAAAESRRRAAGYGRTRRRQPRT